MKILVYGAAEFGQVVRNLINNLDSVTSPHIFAGFIDDYERAWDVIPYEQAKVNHSPSEFDIVIAIGYKDLKTRWAIYQKVKADGYDVISLVHPQAIVDKTARIGEGVIIMAGAIVDYNVEIKDLAVLWNGVVVSHNSVIGENTFLSPNCIVCGCSVVGRDCFVGAGAVVTDHVKMPDGSFVKAGGVELRKVKIVSPRIRKLP